MSIGITNAPYANVSDVFTDGIVTGLTTSVPASSLTGQLDGGIAFVNGQRIVFQGSSYSVAASSTSYLDLNMYGGLSVSTSSTPSSTSLRLWEIVSGTEISSVTQIAGVVGAALGPISQSGVSGQGNQTPLLNVGDAFSDFIASGVQWSVPSPASLTAGMSSGVAYINGVRTLVSEVTGNAFPASNDTYVSVNNSGLIDYQSVANGATAPTPTSGYVKTAKVVTSPIQSPTATLSTSTSGSLASGTYGIALVAFDATGYGAVGASGTVAVTSAQSGSGSIEISWVNPLNETSMDIYATTAGSTTLGLVASGVTGNTYTYTGSVAPGAAAPTVATSNAVQYSVWLMDVYVMTDQPEISATIYTEGLTSIKSNYLGTGFYSSSTLANMLNMSSPGSGANATLKNITLGFNELTRSSSVPGYAINASNVNIYNILVTGYAYDAIILNNACLLKDSAVNGYSNIGVNVVSVDSIIDGCTITNSTLNQNGVGTAIMLTGQVEGLAISNTEVVGGFYSLRVTPQVPGTSNITRSNGPNFNQITNTFFDSSYNGVHLDYMVDNTISNCWFSCRPGNGLTIGENYAYGTLVMGCTAEDCGSHGIALLSGAQNTSVIGCIIKGNNNQNNGSYGIYVADNTSGFTIKDNLITSQIGNFDFGTQAAAIYIGTGCDDYVIEGNYVKGNSASIIDNSRLTATNRTVRNNVGYEEPKNINWLVNSSFDYGIQGWYLPGEGGAWAVNSGQSFNYLNYSASTGTAIFYPASTESITSEDAITAGNIVCLSFWANNETGGDFQAYLGFINNGTLLANDALINIGSGWNFYKSYAMVPSNTTSITFGLGVGQVSTGTNVSIGQIKVEAGASPTEWSDEASSQLFTGGTFQPNFSSVMIDSSTTTNAPTSGSVTLAMPLQGSGGKQVILTFNAYENDTTTNQTINFPMAFGVIPLVLGNNTGLTLTPSTTGVTITAPDSTTAYSGTAVIMGN